MKVRVCKGRQPVSVQQSEAEDDQYTHNCVLEIENVSSTRVFILFCWCWFSFNQECGTGGPEECSQAKFL